SGVQRVEILGWEQVAPFRIATVVPRPCRPGDPELAGRAALELVDLTSRLCGSGQSASAQLREHLRCVKDPGAIADVVGQSFLSDPGDRQRLLEMDEVTDRLTFLVGHLSSLLASGGK
ncbi:MAG: hypothetical protein KGR69_14495, partial [Verrucomicrobia bacterium]|nr:hypothetical protein [Verrucomicrobiota bacterium]